MRRHGNLWEKVIDPENIELAYHKARKGKMWQDSVQYVERNKERVLAEVRQSLIDKTFTTSQYRMKTVYEPKERQIYVLPFVPDRIVQHALLSVVSPLWDRMFDNASNACRPGRGQHSASKQVMNFVRNSQYVLQGDIKKFYPSIHHDVAYSIIEKKIKDKNILWLLKDILCSFPGGKNVPIGNYSSQWIGNLVLNELDIYVRHELKPKGYVRYNDDFVLFGDEKEVLLRNQEMIRDFLDQKLHLTLSKDRVYPTSQGVDFVGYRHFPQYILVRKSTSKRVKKRMAYLKYQLSTKQIEAEKARSVVASTLGWLRWANTFNFQNYLKIDSLQERIYAAV